MSRVEGLLTGLAGLLEIHHGLHLAQQVRLALQVDIGFLHQFEEIDLYPSSGYIPSAFDLVGDLVDFVNVDDAVLSQFSIAVGVLHEIANEVVHVAPNVAGFAELGSVRFYEGHSDQLRDVAHEVGFPNPGGSKQNDVLLRVVAFLELGIFEAAAHVVVVVADRYRNHFLGFPLLDDEAIQVVADFLRLEIEFLDAPQDFGPFLVFLAFGLFAGGIRFLSGAALRAEAAAHGEEGIAPLENLVQVLLQLLHGIFWIVFLAHLDGKLHGFEVDAT